MRSLLIVSASFLLLACSDSRAPEVAAPETPPIVTTSGSPVPAMASGPHVVRVRLVDYRIEMPNQIAAGPTTFAITNDGQHRHNFEIEGQGIEEELEEPLAETQTGSLTVDLKPGRYRVYCPVGDHAEKHGMETMIDVI